MPDMNKAHFKLSLPGGTRSTILRKEKDQDRLRLVPQLRACLIGSSLVASSLRGPWEGRLVG